MASTGEPGDVEAIVIARRDGRTPGERFAIYEREIARLGSATATATGMP